jgi:hypothetical protein
MAVGPEWIAFTRSVLRFLVVFIWMVAVLTALAFVASFIWHDEVVAHFRSRPTGLDGALLVVGLRWMMVVGFAVFALLHRVLKKLIAIVDTVRVGDPFVPENAVRLTQIAWAVLALQVLHLVFGVFAKALSSENAVIDWKFSLTGWVAVLLLFVLARVFEEGTRMRADLEGTV